MIERTPQEAIAAIANEASAYREALAKIASVLEEASGSVSERDRKEMEQIARAALATPEMAFDIGDGLNRYRPCPNCGRDEGMGLMLKDSALAVQCLHCGFRGPAILGSPSARQDKWAFDAWNDIPRETERLSAIQAAAVLVRGWVTQQGGEVECWRNLRALLDAIGKPESTVANSATVQPGCCERAHACVKELQEDAAIAHRWFAARFGDVMNGLDFAVKCAMASRELLEERSHLAAILRAGEPFEQAIKGRKPPNTEEWNALAAALAKARE